jgi:hypothetical protein
MAKKPNAQRRDPNWWKARNARRRAKYAEDAEYRQRVRETSRDNYRKKTGRDHFDPTVNIGKVGDYATERTVTLPDGSEDIMAVLTVEDVADVFGRTPLVIRNWYTKGRIPEAALSAKVTFQRDYTNKTGVKITTTKMVYAIPEVDIMLQVLAPHLATSAYYRADQGTLAKDIFAGVSAYRKSCGWRV